MENEGVIEGTECVSSDSDLIVILEENGDNETNNLQTSSEVVETIEQSDNVDSSQAVQIDNTINIVYVFLLGIVVGLLIWNSFSRKFFA